MNADEAKRRHALRERIAQGLPPGKMVVRCLETWNPCGTDIVIDKEFCDCANCTRVHPSNCICGICGFRRDVSRIQRIPVER